MEDVKVLFKVKKTQLEMMVDRGFHIFEGPDLIFNTVKTARDFVNLYGLKYDGKIITNKNFLSSIYKNGSGGVIKVFYHDVDSGSKQIGDTATNEWLKECDGDTPCTEIIVITNQSPSTNSEKRISQTPALRLAFFMYNELWYNPTKNILVPKHTLIKRCDFEEFVDPGSLPRISMNDPIAKYYGARNGEIFKIESNTYLYGSVIKSSISYRVVVLGFNVLKKTKKVMVNTSEEATEFIDPDII